MQRPHTTSPATKHGKAEKTKSCGYLSVRQVCNASLTTKASEVHHQAESLEAPKRAEWGGNNTPVGHLGPYIQQRQGHWPQHEQKYTKTRGPHEGADRVTTQMSIQTHAGESKDLEPRQCTKKLPYQTAAPKNRAIYHH